MKIQPYQTPAEKPGVIKESQTTPKAAQTEINANLRERLAILQPLNTIRLSMNLKIPKLSSGVHGFHQNVDTDV